MIKSGRTKWKEGKASSADKTWKQPQWPSAGDQINKMWSLHITAMTGEEALTPTAAQMNLESTVLSDRSQSHKTTYYFICTKCPEEAKV